MTNILTNIALANAIFEEKQNYIDTYYPFVLKTFQANEIVTLKIISDQITTIFDFELPIHSIKDILNRREPEIFQIKKNSKSDWGISLTDKGKTELVELKATEVEIETKLSEFNNSFFDWTNPDSPYNLVEIKELIENFLKKNLIEISIKNGHELENIKKINGFEKDFILFLAHIKKTSSSLVRTFEHLWKGAVIWNELTKDDQDKESLEFPKNLSVYVDTNFVFSLLGFHNPIINQAANELHILLTEVKNINLCILDNTLYEIINLLDFYTKVKDDFYDIEVDSIFYYLKSQGYTLSKIEKLKDELRQKLNDDFSIQFIEGSVLTEKKQQWLGTIHDHLFKIRTSINEGRDRKKSEHAIEKGVDHDASVITHVLGQKDRFATRLENSKSIFLTSSFWLFFNYRKIHSEFESTSSVIFDATLTNILYLKNPKKGSQIAIDQIIKSHSNYLIINNNIWDRYIREAKELLKSESIEIEDYSRLVSKNQYSEQLLLENNPDEISSTRVLEILDEIKSDEDLKEEKIKNIETELKSKSAEASSKDQVIGDLTARLKSLEQDKENREAEEKYERDLAAYSAKQKEATKMELDTYLSNLFKTRIWYFTFIIFSILVITAAIILNNYPEIILGENIPSMSTMILIGIAVFLIPFIRSFFKHDEVLKSMKLLVMKRKMKREFIAAYIKSYETNCKKPAIEDYKK